MQYSFRAIKEGRTVSKKIEADNEAAVIAYLKSNGFFPIEVTKVNKTASNFFDFFFGGISFGDVVDMTRQIAIMLNAGLTIIDSLEILKKQITKTRLLKVVESIDAEIKSGNTFSNALKKYPQSFSSLYISLVKSGEASGKLSEILLKLADNLEKEREFKGKLKGAMIYPIIVVTAMIAVMFIMITFVIPQLLNLYKDFNIDLPLTTKILMAVSSLSVRFWPLMIGGVMVGIYLLKNYLNTKQGKLAYDQLMLQLPVVNNVVKISSLVDTTRTLSILIAAGVSILEGLDIVIETTSNAVFQQAFQSVYKKVEKGQSFGAALDQEGIFPPILVQMVIVGEQTGHLDDTLMRLSRYFEMESEIAIKAVTTLIEPAILLFLGLGVGFLVISVITPIYSLTGSIK